MKILPLMPASALATYIAHEHLRVLCNKHSSSMTDEDKAGLRGFERFILSLDKRCADLTPHECLVLVTRIMSEVGRRDTLESTIVNSTLLKLQAHWVYYNRLQSN